LLNCLESTAWSRTDHLVIVSLEVRISIVTVPHLTSGCSASPSVRQWRTAAGLVRRRFIAHVTHTNESEQCEDVLLRYAKLTQAVVTTSFEDPCMQERKNKWRLKIIGLFCRI